MYHRCWYLDYHKYRKKIIRSLEVDIPDLLPDDPSASETPVTRCGQVVMSLNYRFFGIALGGYCLSGSNDLSDYQYAQSSGCRKFRGGYSCGRPVMDFLKSPTLGPSAIQLCRVVVEPPKPIQRQWRRSTKLRTLTIQATRLTAVF